ncbi:S41 family peptidase [Pedobacter sp. AW1-32]|uniref:S41 family peptidase n=1 Tax=Pedobacter sp. AW1-32 TaxID=3383026 RepID=UPI003FEDA81A
MVKNFTCQKTFILAFFVVIAFGTACKKNTAEPAQSVEQGTSGTREELTKDSIYLYAQQTYFWNVGMPTYAAFNPRQYSSNNAILSALKALPSTGGKDKYSFIDEGSVATQLGGTGGDYGFSANFYQDTLRVKYVYASSPATKVDLKRGYAIININGKAVSNTTTADLNSAIFGTNASISMTVEKPDKSRQDVTIIRGTYTINPVLYTNTYTVGGKKVGYLVFNSFTTNASTFLDAAFSKFASDGVTELVVDLRYNGGGSVATSENLTNLIAPSSQNGKLMYTTYWTKTMQDGLATILQNQKFYAKGTDGVTRLYSYFDYSYKPTMAAGNVEYFAKKGSLNALTRVYFLVSSGTASASELLINNLKPVMDVKLIGKTTYGKPVGFFGIHIDKYDLYIPQFQTRNQLDQGDYFSGMTVDKDIVDDLSKDFGDPAEKMLNQALYYSANHSFLSNIKNNNILSSTSGSVSGRFSAPITELDHEFKGMIESKKLVLK